MKIRELLKKKTTWTALALIASAVLPGVSIMPAAVVKGIQTVIVGLALIFARSAIGDSK